jgi:phenylalanyl-tRNA synthetase beta chain
MVPTALEVIAFNLNRKAHNLKFFEFGKTYTTSAIGRYSEANHLCLYFTGTVTENHWKGKGKEVDIFYIKGITEAIAKLAGLKISFITGDTSSFVDNLITGAIGNDQVVRLGKVNAKTASSFDIKPAVYFVNFNWDVFVSKASENKIQYREIPKYPSVERDVAMVVPKAMQYNEVKERLTKLKLSKLQDIKLFDIFENEKLGKDKKSMAINFTFLDEEKTLTDKEIDGWMNNIMTTLEQDLGAEIRK